MVRRIPILICLLLVHEQAGALECLGKATAVRAPNLEGGHLEACTSPSGERDGEFGSWSDSGKRTVWGKFESGREHGVWTVDYPHDGARSIVYLVYEQGVDKTREVLVHIPPTCTAWNEASKVMRAGTLATLTLRVSEQLTGEPAKLYQKQLPGAAVCFATEASDRKNVGSEHCNDDTQFTALLQKRVIDISSKCLLPQRED